MTCAHGIYRTGEPVYAAYTLLPLQEKCSGDLITRIENGESHNEGLCLRCARELHIKPVDEMMEKLGISDADLDNLTGDVAEMLGSMGMLGADADADSDAPDTDADEDDGKTATFPF